MKKVNRTREVVMTKRLSIVVAALMLGTAGAAASELPSFERQGFPITAHQVVVVGATDVAERSSAPEPASASPHQLKVLRPRRE
jgi:hypothetical protein